MQPKSIHVCEENSIITKYYEEIPKKVKDVVLAPEKFMIQLGAVLYNLETFISKASRVN